MSSFLPPASPVPSGPRRRKGWWDRKQWWQSDSFTAVLKAIDDAHTKAVDAVFDAAKPVFRPFSLVFRVIPLALLFGFLVGFAHLNPIISLLVVCGIGPFDILRAAGIVGPKKRDKDGKEIDDFF